MNLFFWHLKVSEEMAVFRTSRSSSGLFVLFDIELRSYRVESGEELEALLFSSN